MTTLYLKRQDTGAQGTFGILYDGDEKIAVTCERPDNGNQKMGCIPVGSYSVTQFQSPHLGADFLVHNVPDREMIEIHSGNTIEDTEGCILVGTALGEIDGQKAITGSKAALSRLLGRYTSGFNLIISEEY